MPYCCNCCGGLSAKSSVQITITDNSNVSPNISGNRTLVYDGYSGWWYYDSDYNIQLYCSSNTWKLDVWKTGGGTTTINLTCNSSTGKLSGSGGGYVISEFDYPCGCCPCCESGSQASSVSITFTQDYSSYVPPDLVGTHILDWNIGESAWKKTFNDGITSVKLSCNSSGWQLNVVKNNEGSPQYFTSDVFCTSNNKLKVGDPYSGWSYFESNPFDRPCLNITLFQLNSATLNVSPQSFNFIVIMPVSAATVQTQPASLNIYRVYDVSYTSLSFSPEPFDFVVILPINSETFGISGDLNFIVNWPIAPTIIDLLQQTISIFRVFEISHKTVEFTQIYLSLLIDKNLPIDTANIQVNPQNVEFKAATYFGINTADLNASTVQVGLYRNYGIFGISGSISVSSNPLALIRYILSTTPGTMTTLPSSDNNFYRNRVLVIKSVCNITFHD